MTKTTRCHFEAFASMLEGSNPGFDRARFLEACGVNALHPVVR